MRPVKILFVSSEVAPFAKTGGLADVAGALPKALRKLGHDVRIVMPAYQGILSRFPFVATLVDGAYRVDDIFCPEVSPGSDNRLSRRTTAYFPALLHD